MAFSKPRVRIPSSKRCTRRIRLSPQGNSPLFRDKSTDSEHAWPIAPNIIDQDFTATAPNQRWAVDISYVWTRERWLYLAVVIDLFSRRVVGWAFGDRLHRDLALAALRKALVMRRPTEGFVHHSDRGSQYCSVDYHSGLRRHGMRTVPSE